jgi:hypothetical protein
VPNECVRNPMRRTACLLALCCLTGVSAAHAQGEPTFQVARVTAPPMIDGDLSDEAWLGKPLDLGQWVTYNPLRGEKVLFRTDVRIVYDDRNIYFAFHCFDDEPDRIRTTVSRRDNVFNDDWIALSLDSAGTGQTAYHLFVNPSGVQMDALNTSSGERFEADVIWDSAGAITDDGYVVEVKLPLQTVRFSGGDTVTMGLVFFRRVSRTGISASWPEMAPGQWVFDRPAHLEFGNLKQPLLLEVLPSVTYGVNQARATPDRWDDADRKGDLGLSVKYGITSNVTLDATVNPDFSQVESDAFQIETNQRFPIFYSEKRPFFMEGMGLFDVAGTGGDGNMRTAVHTRRIINPSWGSKLTGTAGKVTFGLLNSRDASPQDVGDRGDAIAGRKKLFTLGRATYSLGQSNYLGAIVIDTEHAGRHNRVIGGDLSVKFSSRHSFSSTVLASDTGAGASSTRGTASQLSYDYNSRRFGWANQVEHYDRDFQMDTAFFNRAGFTSGWSFGEMNFYPREGTDFWLKRVNPFYFAKVGRDRIQGGDERVLNTGIRFHFTRQAFLNISRSVGREPWRGRQFKTGGGINVFANGQLLRWLEVNGGFNRNRAVYYDPLDPFQGRSTGAWFGVTLQPNQHFSQRIEYDTVRFNRASNDERVFTVNIVNLRTTYQFNRRFLARLIEQYDSSRRRLLTDLLGSYEFVPGTVLHAGYGSLHEERDFRAERLVPGAGDFMAVSRGLFFKASYVHRF